MEDDGSESVAIEHTSRCTQTRVLPLDHLGKKTAARRIRMNKERGWRDDESKT